MKKKKLAKIIGNIAIIGAVATAATAAYTAYSKYRKINKELDTEEYEDDATAAFNDLDFEEPENDSNSRDYVSIKINGQKPHDSN